MNKFVIRFFAAASVWFLAASAKVEARVIQVNPSTGTYCQSISTSTMTQVPPATVGNLSGRNGIVILNLSTNTANMGGTINTGTGWGSTIATAPSGTTAELLFVKGYPHVTLEIGSNLFLWMISYHTSAETVCWQEYIER